MSEAVGRLAGSCKSGWVCCLKGMVLLGRVKGGIEGRRVDRLNAVMR